jgi:hypothetical protein
MHSNATAVAEELPFSILDLSRRDGENINLLS